MLDWEENLFLGLKALYRGVFVRPAEKQRDSVRARLKDHRRTLSLLAQMIAGKSVGILETRDPRLCGSDRIFLPTEFSIASTRAANASLFELKTILGALALRHDWHGGHRTLESCIHLCREEFPNLQARLESVTTSLAMDANLWALMGTLPQGDASAEDHLAALSASETEVSESAITTEIPGQGQADVSVLASAEDEGPGADLPMHTFEKVETLEEYNGLSRKNDDSDELEEHAEALSALTMTQVTRSRERPRSIYRADLLLDGLAIEVDGIGKPTGIPYPEWDFRKREYRRDWCHVKEGEATEQKLDWAEATQARHHGLIQRLRRQFATLVSDWMRLRRQPIGSEFDLDAVVESETERRAGQTPTEFLYIDRQRDVHDVAAMVLLDVSYSTDAWLEDRHVLELITETVFCVGEVLDEYVESFALATFTSNTRSSCQFNLLKQFHAPWHSARGRLGGLKPHGYTRIGPALRHAQELLLNQPARRRMIFLVTDGKPCDYDRYEGRYGMQDVKKAIEVGQLNGIQTHAFAVEKQALESFPEMFSRHDYDVLSRPEALAGTMCKVFARLLAR